MENNTREDFMEKIEVLEGILSETEKPDYVTSAICDIYKTLLENGQFSRETIDHPVIVKRLIKCHRYIPNYILDLADIHRIVIGGLYLNAEICLIPTKLLEQNFKRNRRGYLINPELDGMFPSSMVDYGTLKYVSGDMAVALAKGSELNNWIQLSSQYDYVILN